MGVLGAAVVVGHATCALQGCGLQRSMLHYRTPTHQQTAMLLRTDRLSDHQKGKRGVGLLLLSSRTSHQVRPESGLPIYEIFDMKACRITTLLGAGEREEEEDKTRGKGGGLLVLSSRTVR